MKPAKVADVMTRDVVTISKSTPFKEIVRVMERHRVSGVPVVDVDGRLVGIVTEEDLLWVERDPEVQRPSAVTAWFVDREILDRLDSRADDLRAEDVMSTEVITATAESPILEAVRTLLSVGVKRLPVVDQDRRVVGIVSRADLLKPFLKADSEIEDEIRDEVIRETMWLDPTEFEVRVRGGIVRVEGRVDRRSEKEILVAVIRKVPGVISVDDRVSYEVDDRELRPTGARSTLGWAENWVRAT